ncbi:Hydrogenase 2 maturation protease [Streptomyces sp. ADI96-02]|uniref:hydrogenase maturation protease n=1 Tax=Streptomyces sp. ADI96-02 TaxID=1522760 RepID=UPI000F54DBF7|nr:hydrogenase maturation protease [Streptomyces sp. ADI96-02]RPK54497.1 Hydrogenase 2 maturation protease [Streptomyces sp. ADI96-02]
MTTAGEPRRTLVAGVGNIFLGDDGFGVETVRSLGRLDPAALPPGTELMDAGIRGVHLAYRLLEGYRTLVLVDLVSRGGPPGTLRTIDVGPEPPEVRRAPGPLDTHAMDPATVLGLLHDLHAGAGGTLPEAVYVVGCEPGDTSEGIGLTEPVARAVETAAGLVLDLLRRPAAVTRRH